MYWKLLLGYLPPDRATWPEHLESQRAVYETFVDEFMFDPHKTAPDNDHVCSLLFFLFCWCWRRDILTFIILRRDPSKPLFFISLFPPLTLPRRLILPVFAPTAAVSSERLGVEGVSHQPGHNV